MVFDQKLADEAGRLAAVRRLDVFDTPEERAFEHITEIAKLGLRVPSAAISLIDEDRQWFKARRGVDVHQTSRRLSFCSHAIRQREPLVIENTADDPRFQHHPQVVGDPHIRSYAGAPLVLPDGYQAGALCVVDLVPRQFDAVEIRLLASLADCVVRELELRQRAAIDPMTGFLCRAAFLMRLRDMVDAFRSESVPAVLAIFDIDRFKSVNDRFGHAGGDRVIAEIAAICRDVLGDEAHLGRLGGEEFGIVCPAATFATTSKKFESLRSAIAALRLDDYPELAVTASFGVADLDATIQSVSTWCLTADAALYEAKEAGCNRVRGRRNSPAVTGSVPWALPYLLEPTPIPR